MTVKLKPLHEQVIFVTDATSEIGLATVHRAVEQGAKVFMTARNEDELEKLQTELRLKGYESGFCVSDVSDFDQIQFAIQKCVERFGRLDTFINIAGLASNGRILDTPVEEVRRLFDLSFWGIVNGAKAAIPFLRESGGAIINVGVNLSKTSHSVQGITSAARNGMKSFSDVLRRELFLEHEPIQVTLMLPSSIVPSEAPSSDALAKMILKCAVRPTREMGMAALFPALPLRSLSVRDSNVLRGERSSAIAPNRPNIFSELSERKGILSAGIAAIGLGLLFYRRLRSEA